jgi:hypothetical protein
MMSVLIAWSIGAALVFLLAAVLRVVSTPFGSEASATSARSRRVSAVAIHDTGQPHCSG